MLRSFPKISVVVITYNHEDFIEPLLVSILTQEGDFELELIVADDASSDRTFEICEKVRKEFDTIQDINFEVIRRKKNLGMVKNFIDACSRCGGEFIAFAEGDDIWLDNCKIKKQLRVMKKGFGVSISDCALLDERGGRIAKFSKHRTAIDGKDSGEISSNDLISSPLRAWHLSSAMISRDCLPKELNWLIPFPIFDYGFFALTVDGCTVHYSSEELAGYRKHTSSVTAGRPFNFSYLVTMDKMLRQLASKIPDKKLAIRSKRLSNFYFFVKHCVPYRRSFLSIIATPLLLSLNKWSPYSLRDELYLLKKAWIHGKDH